jgi:ribosomal protein S6--L-glutamate ligase
VTATERIGWEEWVALPALGILAVKAKIDTGAKTSALHAFDIAPVREGRVQRVRFKVHPVQRRSDIVIEALATVLDERSVTSSNGERETRYVITTDLSLGTRNSRWPIEITLTNRATMNYRMLLGREALRHDLLIDPARSFLAGRLSHKLYRKK